MARAIKARGTSTWGETAVLARNKALLERVRDALAKESIPSFVAQRRDEFVSAECSWLHAVLKQLVRPADRRNMSVVIESFNRMAGCELPPEQLLSESDVTGRTLLGEWLQAVPRSELDPWFR